MAAAYLFHPNETCRVPSDLPESGGGTGSVGEEQDLQSVTPGRDLELFRLSSVWGCMMGEAAKPKECAEKLMMFYQDFSRLEHGDDSASLRRRLGYSEGDARSEASAFRARYDRVAAIRPSLGEGNSSSMGPCTSSAAATAVAMPSTPPVAVFVLGPSAAGKTHTTRLGLRKALRANGVRTKEDRCFTSIDGGLMREPGVSRVWDELKRLRDAIKTQKSKGVAGCEGQDDSEFFGFSDAYKQIGQVGSGYAKRHLVEDLVGKKANIIFPDTAAGCFELTCNWMYCIDKACPFWKAYEKLKEDYKIVMIAINTDRANCEWFGQARQVDEGKIYTSSAWTRSMEAIKWSFHKVRKDFPDVGTFFIFDNNEYEKLPRPRTNSQVKLPPPLAADLEFFTDDWGAEQKNKKAVFRGKWASKMDEFFFKMSEAATMPVPPKKKRRLLEMPLSMMPDIQ